MAIPKLTGDRTRSATSRDCRRISRFLALSAFLHLAAVPFLSLFLDQAQKISIATTPPPHQVTLIETSGKIIESATEALAAPQPKLQPSLALKETKSKTLPLTPEPEAITATPSSPSLQPEVGPTGAGLTVEKAGQYLSEGSIKSGIYGPTKKVLPLPPLKGSGNIFKSSITICTDNIDNDKDGPKDFQDPDCKNVALELKRSIWELKQILDASD